MTRPKVVVLGMLARMPVGGVVWQTAHYLVGLERLGCEVWYVEAHGNTPLSFCRSEDDPGTEAAAVFLDQVTRRFGLTDRWAMHALHDDGRVLGLSASGLRNLYASAALVVNLHGGTSPRPEHTSGGPLVFLETDPVRLQIELHDERPETIAMLEPHDVFFTFGENYGHPGCGLPVSDRFPMHPTRQPVLIDQWERAADPGPTWTTVGNWRQSSQRIVELDGETYTWSKHTEWAKVLDVPRRSGLPVELALTRYNDTDQHRLERHGFTVRPAAEISTDADDYRRYIAGSRGELTVAKDQNVRLRTGWFSDRSATYLAAGRPVVTQDTGFGDAIPTGEGLFAFTAAEDAVAAMVDIEGAWDRHSKAATAIAHEYFDSNVVLGNLLDVVGVRP